MSGRIWAFETHGNPIKTDENPITLYQEKIDENLKILK